MSEFSKSYHIRTDAPKEILGRLRAAGFAGFAFPPANGWLTFVPFPMCKALGRSMSAGEPLMLEAGTPVLEYSFAEDHGWSFTLYRPGMDTSRLEQTWETGAASDKRKLEIDSLAELAVDVSKARVIRSLLTATPSPEVAIAFADAIGLPAYRWLSPEYIQSDPESFKEQGGRQVGPRPKDPLAGIICPAVREIEIPRPDLSAREALALFNLVMRKSHADWFPVEIYSQGGGSVLNEEGRLAHGGEWCVKYRQAGGPAVIKTFFRPDLGRRLVFMAERIDFIGNHPLPEAHIDRRPPEALPEDFLDSPEVMAIASTVAAPDDLAPPNVLMLLLRRTWQQPVHWEVRRRWWDQTPNRTLADLIQAVDKRQAMLLGSVFQRFDGDTVIEQWRS